MSSEAITRPATAAIERRAPRRRRRRPSAWHLLLMPLSLIFIFPFVQMLFASLMTTREINAYPPALFPRHPSLTAYRTVLQESDFPTWFKNSLIVTTVAVVSQLILCPLAGYAFARMRFIGTRTLQLLLLTTVFIPPQLLMIPVYKMYAALGIVGTLPSLFLPWMASAISIFLMRQFFIRLPREIEEAAMIDGCSRSGAFWRITFPLLAPGLVATGVFGFIQAWNEFTLAVVVMTREDKKTLPVWLAGFLDVNRGIDWGGVMAGSTLIAIPVIVFFLVVQGRMVSGLTAGAVKG